MLLYMGFNLARPKILWASALGFHCANRSRAIQLKLSIVATGEDDRCETAEEQSTRAGRARRSCFSGEVQQQRRVLPELRQRPYHPAMESSPWNSHQDLQISRP